MSPTEDLKAGDIINHIGSTWEILKSFGAIDGPHHNRIMIREILTPDSTREDARILEISPSEATLLRKAKVTSETRENRKTGELLSAALEAFQRRNLSIAYQKFAEFLLEKHSVITHPITRRLYVYNPALGYYSETGEDMLRFDIAQILKADARKNAVSEILAKVNALSYAAAEDLEATTPPNLIPLQNGVYNLTTGELLPHSSRRFFTYVHPADYEPGATCPTFTAFLQSSVATRDEQEILLDIIAICLHRTIVTRHFFILVGSGHNGKTRYVDVVKKILGKERTVSLTPQVLAEDKFASAQLYDRHANIGAEITASTIKDIGTIKAITGGDSINAQRKGVDGKDVYPYCKFIWASNTPPKIGEDTYALWDRLVVVEFPYTFVDNPNADGEKLADPELEVKMTTPSELSGLLNLALQRLPVLLRTHKLSVYVDPGQMRQKYRAMSDTVRTFLEERCEEVEYDPGPPAVGFETATTLYRSYKEWCKANRARPVTANSFGRTMTKDNFSPGRDAVGKGRSYQGIRLKDCNVCNVPLILPPGEESKSQYKGIVTNVPYVTSNPVSFEALLDQLSVQHPELSRDILARVLEMNLTKRAEAGDIFSPRPGVYVAVSGEVRL